MNLSDINPLELADKRPDWCAKLPLTKAQRNTLIAIAAVFVLALLVFPFATASAFVLVSSVFYLAITVYKLWIIGASVRKNAAYRFSAEELAVQRDWPVFSILVPMYKEPEVVPQMVRGLCAMDYPTDKLDVQLLLEEDDTATVAAARATPMPPNFRVTVVPPSFPRTKPKACNFGLALAKGEYLVIYDAEDRPEPDQLKKAVLSFEAAGPKVACVQSCLNFYNPRQNLLTRFFTGDYSAWFDLQLPGLAARKAVIPLGGTSNHFRTAILRDLLGWDAYNVTEDCDLGVRLCRAGYTTAMVDTTTWEEACSSVPFWIRQRTRWIKGYFQTWFVHMRHPMQLFRELGPRNFLHFQALVGGVCLSFLLNPVFWALALLWFLVRPAGIDRLFPGPVFAIGAFCLFAGNFLFVYTILLGCYRRRQDRLLWANLLAPAYWVLMSIAGWRAFIQFFKNPFLWEKTQHALGGSKRVTADAAPTATSSAPSPAPSLDAQAPSCATEAVPSKTQPIPVVSEEGSGEESSSPLSIPSPQPPTPNPKSPAPSLRRTAIVFCLFAVLVLTVFIVLSSSVTSGVYPAVGEQIAAGSTCGRQALVGSSYWAPLPLLFGALFDPLGPALQVILSIAAVVLGLAWLFNGSLAALIPLAFALGGTVLCGFTAWGFTAVGLALLVLGVLVRKRRLTRTPATLLLGALPAVYSFLVWMLLSALILQDATYFLKPVAALTRADLPLLFGKHEQPIKQEGSTDPLLASALSVARERSPYARIFLCGYEGLEIIGDYGLPEEDAPITPVLDLHLEELRKAYHGQVHFLLVKAPTGEGRFESHSLRHPDLYEFGAPGTILAADFGEWRLYELVTTELGL